MSHHIPSRRSTRVIAAAASVAAALITTSASAATFTYNPPGSATNTWSSGTNWSAVPVSATDTRLTFITPNTTVLADGTVIVSTNDIDNGGNPFALNILDLQGTGPATGGASVSIGAAAPGVGLSFVGTNPTVNLNALGALLTYNITQPVTLGANTLFTGAGTAAFNFNGITGTGFTMTKQGASTLTLNGATTLGSFTQGNNTVGGAIVGPGGSSFSIGAANVGTFAMGVSGGTASTATLNALAASSFNASVSTFQVGGAGGSGNGAGVLNLPASSTISASTSVLIANSGNAFNLPTFNGGVSTVTTAAGGTATFRTPTMTVGGNKSRGELIVGAGSTLDISGLAAGARAALIVGQTTAGGGSGTWTGNLDASAGTFVANLSALNIGIRTVTASSAIENGTLTLGSSVSNHLDVLGASTATTGVVNIGRGFGGSTSGSANGVLTIGNLDSASQIVDTNNGSAILLATPGTGITASGTLNLNGGTLKITTTGLAMTGGGGTSTVNFNGTTLKPGASSANWISNLTTANINVGGALFDTNSFAITVPQSFSGTGGLTKLGNGTLTLNGASSYTGPTAVNAGELNLTGSLASDITINNSAVLNGEGTTSGALNFTGSSRVFFDPSSGGSFNSNTVNGSGATVEFLATNATNGTGILVLNAPGGITGIPNTNFIFNSRGSIYLAGGGTQLLVDKLPAASLKWKGNAPSPTFWDIRTTANWDNGGSPDLFYNADDVLFDDTASSFVVAIQPSSLSPNTVTFNNNANVYTVTGGAINGAASVTMNGTSTAILANDNTYSGGTIINSGTVQLGNGGATGSMGAGPVNNNGAIVTNFGANTATVANAISGGGTLTKNGTGRVIVTGANTYSGGTTIAAGTVELAGTGSLGSGNVTNDGAIITTGSNVELPNNISGTGTFTQASAGTVTLSGSNTYSGGTTINPGATLMVGNGGGTGSTGTSAVANSGTLTLNRSDSFTLPAVITGTGTLAKMGAGIVTLSPGTTTAGSLAIGTNTDGGTLTVAGGTTLSVGNAGTGTLSIGLSTNANAAVGALDASAPSGLSVNVANIIIGATGNNSVTSQGKLLLPSNSSLTATTAFILGDSLGARNGQIVNDVLTYTSDIVTAAGGTTTVRTPTFTIGGSKSSSVLTLGAGNTLDVAGVTSTLATAMSVGSMSIGGGAGTYTMSADLSAGVLKANLGSLQVANQNTGTSSSVLLASMVISNDPANHLEISGPSTGPSPANAGVLIVGRQQDATATGTVTGSLTIGNLDATSNITSTDNGTAILVAGGQNPGFSTGTLNLNGGTLKLTTTGSGIAGGLGNSTVNFNGATLVAGASSSTWIQNLTSANVLVGGAKFDSNGFSVSAPQVFTGTGALTKSGVGTLTLAAASTYTGATNVNAGMLAFATSFRSSSALNIADAAIAAMTPRTSGVKTLQVGALNLNSTGTLDTADNDLVVDNGSFTDIYAAMLAGVGSSGPGIISSTSDGSQILAMFDNALVGATDWNGGAIAASAIVGKYTYFGDANIDGQVTGDDYTVVDANLDTTPSVGLGWLSGDMNLDGTVTGDDYTVIDANLGLGVGNPLSPSSLSAVPEPAACAIVAVGAGMLLARGSRRRGA